jgi:hypothetical protein
MDSLNLGGLLFTSTPVWIVSTFAVVAFLIVVLIAPVVLLVLLIAFVGVFGLASVKQCLIDGIFVRMQ